MAEQDDHLPFFTDELTEIDLDIEVEGETASEAPADHGSGLRAAPPALPVPLVRVRRPADAWLDEIPEPTREVLEKVRHGRVGRAGRPVTRAIASANKAIPSLRG